MWLTNAKKADRKWNTCSVTDAAERALFLFLWTLIVRSCAGSMPCFAIVVRNESRVRWIVRLTLSKSDFVGVYYFIQKNTPQQQSLFQYNDRNDRLPKVECVGSFACMFSGTPSRNTSLSKWSFVHELLSLCCVDLVKKLFFFPLMPPVWTKKIQNQKILVDLK